MGAGYASFQMDLKSAVEINTAIQKELSKLTETSEEFHQNLGARLNLSKIVDNDLHATLMYDKRDPDISPGINRKTYKAKVINVERLGTPGKPFYALVLTVESAEIQNRFKELLELGFEHSFPELKIHVSLMYGDGTELCHQFVKKLFDEGKLPETITLGNEQWTECKV